jgi:putative molybdopterin biosynthesis protein
VMLAPVGDRLVALPLRGDTGAGLGFLPAGGFAVPGARAEELIAVRPIGPPRPTLLVAGCDPALPLLATPLSLLDPPVAFAWWPCGSGEALRLAQAGLVHAAGMHSSAEDGASGGSGGSGGSARNRVNGGNRGNVGTRPGIPDGAQVVGFTAWREGLVVRPGLRATVTGLDAIAKHRLRLVNREPGAEARLLLDRERLRLNLETDDLIGYDTQASGHLQVASAVAAGLADAGVASEPAARAYGLGFVPLARERFNLVIPAEHAASREAQALLKVLTSPWLLAQLASIPGYDAATCGERFT